MRYIVTTPPPPECAPPRGLQVEPAIACRLTQQGVSWYVEHVPDDSIVLLQNLGDDPPLPANAEHWQAFIVELAMALAAKSPRAILVDHPRYPGRGDRPERVRQLMELVEPLAVALDCPVTAYSCPPSIHAEVGGTRSFPSLLGWRDPDQVDDYVDAAAVDLGGRRAIAWLKAPRMDERYDVLDVAGNLALLRKWADVCVVWLDPAMATHLAWSELWSVLSLAEGLPLQNVDVMETEWGAVLADLVKRQREADVARVSEMRKSGDGAVLELGDLRLAAAGGVGREIVVSAGGAIRPVGTLGGAA